MPVAREPKKPRRGTLAREKTPPLQVCRSKTLDVHLTARAKMSLNTNKNSYGATDLENGGLNQIMFLCRRRFFFCLSLFSLSSSSGL